VPARAVCGVPVKEPSVKPGTQKRPYRNRLPARARSPWRPLPERRHLSRRRWPGCRAAGAASAQVRRSRQARRAGGPRRYCRHGAGPAASDVAVVNRGRARALSGNAVCIQRILFVATGLDSSIYRSLPPVVAVLP
jgi:hypothetical protein